MNICGCGKKSDWFIKRMAGKKRFTVIDYSANQPARWATCNEHLAQAIEEMSVGDASIAVVIVKDNR
jgi:hypothetical protein